MLLTTYYQLQSYATGLVHYTTLRYNHDSETLKKTQSLMDPGRSSLHASINRIGKVMQAHTDVFHVETVLDDNRFPFYLRWVQILFRRMHWIQKAMARISCFFLKFLPNWLRLWIFWGPLVRGQFGLVQCVAGETEAVHKQTLEVSSLYVFFVRAISMTSCFVHRPTTRTRLSTWMDRRMSLSSRPPASALTPRTPTSTRYS